MNSNWMFVGAAFTVTWAVIVGYLIHVRRTLARARTSLDLATRAGAR
ncbi:MAG: CcmD family protein [bacterium]